MSLSSVRSAMEHNVVLRTVVSICRSCGLIHAMHIVKSFMLRCKMHGCDKSFYDFYINNKEKYNRVLGFLGDEFSKATYEAVLEYRCTLNIQKLSGIIVQPQYFQMDILEKRQREIFVDGGAYIGDTAVAYMKYFQKHAEEPDKLYLWECDKKNIDLISKVVGNKLDYEIIPKAMWSHRTKLNFRLEGSSGSRQDATSETFVDADSIDNYYYESGVTFIKMDIEGAEIEALKGAEKTIRRYKPKLAICIYHRPSDLYEIPIMIHDWVPEYKIYIRHHSDTFAETVMYATL